MEENEQKAQEMYTEYQMVDQHIKQLQRQIEVLTNQLMELSATSNSLDDFGKVKIGKEIFVPLSSGIFAKAVISDTSGLLVNVGANVVVKKDIASTKNLIVGQIDEIKKLHQKMVEDLEKMANKAAHLEMQLQSIMPQG